MQPGTARPSQRAPAHELRIIGGVWKRSKLAIVDKPGLRPTPDRVRETLFNWLGQDLSGRRCFDAFAGTGALGFEAASRGAASVVMVEQDRALVLGLRSVRARLQAAATQVVRGDGVLELERAEPASLDVVFLDPPFDSAVFAPALCAARRAVSPQGVVYLEAPVRWSDTQLELAGFRLLRFLRAGAVHAHLLAPGTA